MKTDGPRGMEELKDTFLQLSFPNPPKQSHSECMLLPIAAHTLAQCLSSSASYRTAHLLYSTVQYRLYSLILKCTYGNYTEAAAT
jgi:hypothetical protein